MIQNQKINRLLADIKSLEGQALDKVKMGSKEPAHYLDMSYYSGVGNGIKFIIYLSEHPLLMDADYQELVSELLHYNPLKSKVN